MTPQEREMMLKLFEANPVLTTENTCIRAIFQYTLKSVVDDLYSDLPANERVEIYSETLLEVEELMESFNGKERTLN